METAEGQSTQLTLDFTQEERAVAKEIVTAHELACALVKRGKEAIGDAIDAAMKCAALVEAARCKYKSRFPDIWRELIGLSPMEQKRYISLHAMRDRPMDKRQLCLSGIVDTPEQEEQTQRPPPDPFAWCRWVPKIVEALPDEAIERMTYDQRAVACKTLEPAHNLWLKLQPKR